MSRWIFIILSIAFISFSCTDSSTEPNKPVLTPSERTVTIAQWSYHWFTITGGIGPVRVKSITDSSIIANVMVTSSGNYQQQPVYSVQMRGVKLGSTDVTFTDSAGAASVTVPVTVATMAFEHSEVSILEGTTQSLYIQGGTMPHALVSAANDGYASYIISGSTVVVTAQAPGTTVLTIRDNAPVPNMASVTITILPRPVFTTAGQISFSSNAGDFTADGIYKANDSGPLNEQGAGGWLQGMSGAMVYCEFVAYRHRPTGTYDVAFLSFTRRDFTAGTMGIGLNFEVMDSATVLFVMDIALFTTTDVQRLYSGTVAVTSFSRSSVAGSFSGSGKLMKNGVAGPLGSLEVTNGTFSVPLLIEDFSRTEPASAEQRKVKELVRRSGLLQQFRKPFMLKERQ